MTNSRSLSWIDRGHWAGLLAKVTEDPPPAARSVTARPPPRPGPPHAPPLPAVPLPAPTIELLPPPPAKVAAGYQPFSSSSRNLEERLQALVTWIEACVPCRAAFIADDNGLPVVEHLGAEPGQIAAASSILLMLASVRSLMRDSGGWLSLKLGDAILHVVEVATPWGRFGIGIVTDDSLTREFLAALSAAVEHAFHGELAEGELS
jgi:hypothetical protein